MPYTTAGKNIMLDGLAVKIGLLSLHTADPGTTGTNEVSGGVPAYARKATTWFPASGGNLDNNTNPIFDCPGGITVTYVGFWSNDATPVFLASGLIASATFPSQGTLTLTDADLDLNAV